MIIWYRKLTEDEVRDRGLTGDCWEPTPDGKRQPQVVQKKKRKSKCSDKAER